jgi:hypothetical protein
MLVLCLLAAVPGLAQDAPLPQTVTQPAVQPVAQSVPGAPNLFRLEGVDPESGHYIRLMLMQTSDTPSTRPASDAPPRLTFECVEKDGKRDLRLYVSFGGIRDMSFTPPFHPKPGVPYKLIPTDVKLKMRFVGYMNWKPYVESWRLMENGEYRYRDSGWHSPNMESIQFVLKMLNSLPGMRIVHEVHVANDPGEVFFQTRPLLDELNKTPMCSP